MATTRKKTARKKTSPRKSATGKKTSTRKKAPTRKKGAKKKSTRTYGPTSQKKVHKAMDEMKGGKLRSGRSGKKVTSRKQAIAIGLSEARQSGAKVPEPKSGSRKKS